MGLYSDEIDKVQAVDPHMLEPSSFSENISSAFEDQFKNRKDVGRHYVPQQRYQDEIFKLRKAGFAKELGLDNNIFNSDPEYDPIQNPDVAEKIFRDNHDRLVELQQSHPELGIKTADQISSESLNEHREAMIKSQDAYSRSTFTGKLGYFLGTTAGFVADPVAASSFAVGGVASLSGSTLSNSLKSAISFGMTEGSIAGALEGLQKRGEIDLRRDLGEEVSTQQAVKEIVSVALFAGAVAAPIGAAIPGLVGLFKKLPSEAQDAARVLAERDRILKSVPEGVVSDSSELARAASQFVAADKPRIRVQPGASVERSIEDSVLDAGLTEKSEDLPTYKDDFIRDFKNKLDAIELTDETLGQITGDKEIRAQLDRYFKEDSALKKVETCLKGSSGVVE